MHLNKNSKNKHIYLNKIFVIVKHCYKFYIVKKNYIHIRFYLIIHRFRCITWKTQKKTRFQTNERRVLPTSISCFYIHSDIYKMLPAKTELHTCSILTVCVK